MFDVFVLTKHESVVKIGKYLEIHSQPNKLELDIQGTENKAPKIKKHT